MGLGWDDEWTLNHKRGIYDEVDRTWCVYALVKLSMTVCFSQVGEPVGRVWQVAQSHSVHGLYNPWPTWPSMPLYAQGTKWKSRLAELVRSQSYSSHGWSALACVVGLVQATVGGRLDTAGMPKARNGRADWPSWPSLSHRTSANGSSASGLPGWRGLYQAVW